MLTYTIFVYFSATITDPPFCNHSSILTWSPYFFLWYFFLVWYFFLCLQIWILWDFLLHGENEIWWYTLPKGVAWSWRHSAQSSVTYLYSSHFIKCTICYIWVLREIGAKFPELDDLRSKTCNSHTRISISAPNMVSLLSCWPMTFSAIDWGCQTLKSAAWHIATNLQKGQSKTFCRLLQWIMGSVMNILFFYNSFIPST